MGKRYESQDATGAHVWLEDGMEVHEVDDGFRICFDPARVREATAWVPGEFASVDEAFQAGRVAQSLSG